MYFVGIDISKYKHDCFITTETGDVILNDLTFSNNRDGFNELLSVLTSLDHNQGIRIGFEATGHYALNLKLFLEETHYSFMEFNAVLLSKFNHSQTLRKTKTDAIDCASIARWLMTVEYKPYPIGFYHMYSLKSLTRLRDSLVRQRSFYLVKMTNVLDHVFPEFKPFFKNRLGKTALLLLTKYGSAAKIASMNSRSYDELRRVSRGKFSMYQFLELRTLAKNTVGESNTIFDLELSTLLNLYQNLCSQVNVIESEITILVTDLNRPIQTIPGIGPLSAAVILSEFGDVSRFKSPAGMLSFAGLEPAYYQSGTSEYTGHMVKRGSSHLRYTLMTVCLPIINHNIVFAEYYHKKRLEGKPHRVALSHVAKKLLRVIFTLETRNIKFDPEKIR